MTPVVEPRSELARSQCLTEVVTIATGRRLPLASEAARVFITSYFEHVLDEDLCGVDPARLAGLVSAHLRLGLRRAPGEHLIGISSPRLEPDGWDAGGSTVIQVVADDRPFLVDTVLMELSRRGWSVRRLLHPQFRVERADDGTLMGTAADTPQATAESWISLEAFAPLGQAAADLADPLLDGLVLALDAVAVAVDDQGAIGERVLAAIAMLDVHPQPVSPQEVRQATDLLGWLARDNFVFLGYREFGYDGTSFRSEPGTGLGILRGSAGDDTSFHAVPGPGERSVLVMTKDTRRSPVQRPAFLDYLGVRVYGPDGRLVGEHRFLGLLAASAYAESVAHIPVLAAKAEALLHRSGYEPHSFGWNSLWQVITGYPRDELFQADLDELATLVSAVAALPERRQVRVFQRRERYGRFWSVLVYLPRDRYNTAVRLKVQAILLDAFGGESLEYTSLVSESVLARLWYVVSLPRETSGIAGAPDVKGLERSIEAATRTWEDEFNDAVATLSSEERGVEFGEAYEAAFPADVAVADLRLANQLTASDDLRFQLYSTPASAEAGQVRFKVFTLSPMSLTQVMPHLSMLGVEVGDERPFVWDLRGRQILLYDFGLRLPGHGSADWDEASRSRFVEAFAASYRGDCEADLLNRLVLTAALSWRQVTWLRGISRYLLQAGTPYSQAYLAQALCDNVGIAAGLVGAFETRFDPDADLAADARAAALSERDNALGVALDAVSSLDQDRILRMFLAVIQAMLRTNAFAEGQEALAFKLRPGALTLLPQPRPAFEVFVYSPRVQGVHMRFGAVARGGIRWSDRKEDFRTEVLGLVKAQLVKNAVIVPVGAKGGFVPQQLPDVTADRAGWLAEGIACYRTFIGSLLGLTDNIVGGAVVPPPRVLRYDGDDPYLVVAADKGTATFSDIANAISLERGFWLGDAFASGGSAGYDHKKMGITARGAWESVKRHFVEMGRDCQHEDFTCIGIGDMSGDVFGNGMLLSRHLRLVAAFNHQHIFLDPDPDAAAGYAERLRLFGLPRSSWDDYDTALISAGGGVYPRSAKSVPISPEVRRRLDLGDDVIALPPNELMSAILRAPVDLLWNGGIGTYAKASSQSHAEVGDKANDGIRVNGGEVRARCVGEGGNLGWTQRGRVEYALGGGRINTDFIDNSAGVDTSDHEVNIKILLAGLEDAGVLDHVERDRLLASMTDEVAQLVLAHNVDQNLALANSMVRASELAGQHEAWMRTLEAMGLLDRGLEDMPGSDEMKRRIADGRGLTRPELATLLAYTKIALYSWVLAGDLPEDPYLADRLYSYFPKPLRERFAEAIPHHRLARQIIATVAVNRFVNSQGISAYHRLSTETGAGVADVIRAQLAARSIFSVGLSEVLLGRITGLDAALVTELRMELRRMVERAARWLLHNRRGPFNIQATIDQFGPGVAQVRAVLGRLITPRQRAVAEAAYHRWTQRGVDIDLAAEMATAAHAHFAFGAVQTAQRRGLEVTRVAEVHFRIAEVLGLDQLAACIDVLPRQVRWDAMARAALRDELLALHGELTADAMGGAADREAGVVVEAWLAGNPDSAARAAMVRQVCEGTPDLARMSVGLGAVRALLPGG